MHDFAYADVSFDGYQPPSILQVPGADDVAVETYSLTKSFSMAGWRVGFALGNAPALAALARLKSYLDYGTFQPIQIASIVALNEARDYPAEACEIYRKRRDVLCDGLGAHRLARRAPARDDVRLGADPGALPGARLARVRRQADARGARRRQPRRRVRPRRRGFRPLRARRERAADRPGRARNPPGAAGAGSGSEPR